MSEPSDKWPQTDEEYAEADRKAAAAWPFMVKAITEAQRAGLVKAISESRSRNYVILDEHGNVVAGELVSNRPPSDFSPYIADEPTIVDRASE